MRLQLTTTVCVLALTACMDHAARDRLGIVDPTVLKSGVGVSQDAAAGAANAQWVSTYASIGNNRDALESLQQRLNQIPDGKREYFHAKAQCWLTAAREARLGGSQWGFAEEAIGQAAVLTLGLESGAPLSAVNPTLRTVSTVRPDLWQIVHAIKADRAVALCRPAQPPLACAEVELMQAGHDAWRRSFSDAEMRVPHIQSQLRDSADIALQCKQVATVVPVPQPSARQIPEPDKITLRTDSLFRFNDGNEAAMLALGRRQLDTALGKLKASPAHGEVRITGYADRLGDKAHNQALSLQRAKTVEHYLRSRGLSSATVASGRGSANPLVDCGQKKRAELVRCLAPNRRVEIELSADES